MAKVHVSICLDMLLLFSSFLLFLFFAFRFNFTLFVVLILPSSQTKRHCSERNDCKLVVVVV
jgi:hypothetical protein